MTCRNAILAQRPLGEDVTGCDASHAQVATAVGEAAFQDGMAQIEKPENLENYMADRMWCGAVSINAHNHC
jgi:malic enzyme